MDIEKKDKEALANLVMRQYNNEKRFHESLDNLTSRDVYLRLSEQTKNIRRITKIKVYKE